MNIALVFAGGTGQRMGTKSIPKQFLKVHGKPIIIYTLEHFSSHEDIDAIIVVCLESHIDYLNGLIDQFKVKKVKAVIPGGKTGQESIFKGLEYAMQQYAGTSIVLIHDGVRPFLDKDVITQNIKTARGKGNAVTVVPSIETVILKDGSMIDSILDRRLCYMAKAPQTFRLEDIYNAHIRAREEGFDKAIDSASLMSHYGEKLHTVEGSRANIKITTQQDFYFMRSLIDMEENEQLKLL